MALLGVLARVESVERGTVEERLSQYDGVSTFSVDEPGRIGILIERDTIDEAQRALTQDVAQAPGVLGTWPVFSHFESEIPTSAHRAEADDDGKHAS